MSLTLAATAALTALLQAGPGGPIYHGREGATSVELPRAAADIDVNGQLDEPVWSRAALLTGFSQYQPVDGLPAADSTEVLVWYSADAIHFGIRAWEPHAAVNATLADRDEIGGDDFVTLLLDTFDDRRRAFLFSVNALGVQSDGIRSEGEGSGGRRHGGNREVDLSPDFVWASAGRITDYGYEVEVRIPFKSLRYQTGERQDWGLNVIRNVQHSGYEQSWTPAERARASLLAQSGTLRGLHDLHRGLVMDVQPVLTTSLAGAPRERADGTTGDWRYGSAQPEVGGNVRWGVTADLTLNGTVNPDFSQIEADAGQVNSDPRRTLFFSEQRPFFLEGNEYFNAPNSLIYTRRIGQPAGAAKLTGRVAGFDVGYLAAVDDPLLSHTDEHPIFNILRARRDFGASNTVGLAYTDRMDGDYWNRVAAVDGRFVLRDIWEVTGQYAGSFTHAPGLRQDGAQLYSAQVRRNGRRFGVRAELSAIHPDFVAAAGFIGRSGIAQAQLSPEYTWYGAQDAFVERFTGGLRISGDWTYERYAAGLMPDDQKVHLTSNFALRGGWSGGADLMVESFLYPAELYDDYVLLVERGGVTDTVPYSGRERIPNYDLLVRLSTPQFPRWNGFAFVVVGRDENFFEWSPAWIVNSTLSVNYRPDDRLRLNLRYVQQRYNRSSDGSLVGVQHIPRVKAEYQLSRPLFVRFVGQYATSWQDDLRDDTRTELPIWLRRADGTLERASGHDTSSFRADWLLSYQPTPGTVVFAGYGTSLGDAPSFRFGELARQSDGFFLKVTYLWRL
ncbi:MAG: DUF5916 domain-containing protein [Gemmatimonadota bacterium]